ncbi:MAG: alkaline phosphatase family protein [Anaerolineaceae bacterium]|jgi:hypothetical protein|nr:alkaline phosphatase family protein [Anaerolineaceae bacterium]OQY88600.1 MAG: hypothetical protein B6D38_09545 [Anaerolineae bacterium UTCFX1]
MKQSRYFLPISIFLSLLIAGAAYFWANALMDSLYAYRSPLQNSPPQAGEALGKPITRRVVMVLVDALREDTATNVQVMPYLNELRQQGATAVTHSRTPSYSVPGYSVLMSGAWPDLSDGPTMNPEDGETPRAWTQDNLFYAAHRNGLKTAVSGYNWFEGLIPAQYRDASYFTSGEDANADRDVVDAALPWFSGDYQLILIHIDQVDYAGHHQGGPRDPHWNQAATRADALIKEIASQLDFSQDTFVLFSDHGQIDAGGHGGTDPIVLIEPFVAVGAGIAPGDYGDIHMVDIAPTIAALLGINIPAVNQGNVLTDMLTLTPASKTAIEQALAAQQATLLAAYAEAIGRPIAASVQPLTVGAAQALIDSAKASRLTSERIPRLLISILLFAAIGYALWKYWNRAFLWMGAGALVYAALFHIRYALIAGRTYSLSSVASASDIVNFTAAAAAVALVILWLALFIGLGLFKQEPHRAAESVFELTFAILLLLSLPIAWSFISSGATIGWALPNMLGMFIAFICILQALVIAALGIVLSGISAVIAHFARPRSG